MARGRNDQASSTTPRRRRLYTMWSWRRKKKNKQLATKTCSQANLWVPRTLFYRLHPLPPMKTPNQTDRLGPDHLLRALLSNKQFIQWRSPVLYTTTYPAWWWLLYSFIIREGGANYRVWLFYERIFWLQPLWASFNLISFTYLLEIAPITYVQGTIGSQTQIWLEYSMKLCTIGEFCEKNLYAAEWVPAIPTGHWGELFCLF